ncbi:hypothetical protein BU24DRAFT_468089 [Aaosphaeria arxii CBS 175.79]|uniref:Uncharacterized protein n=1 Tax=Aaosphaeria arxii CBS 175.79 TaxID=1450172 RepID=A0A6A5XA06_9PLEO|nr:uncharacterized protein BU24DRAFT_468089 [Aaosphaeria arxii CBS 175.79]KAF2009739.1 hypothetical protein BU24DRAFT_468089 [Aaosphaeria arxii CBS 175.79]
MPANRHYSHRPQPTEYRPYPSRTDGYPQRFATPAERRGGWDDRRRFRQYSGLPKGPKFEAPQVIGRSLVTYGDLYPDSSVDTTGSSSSPSKRPSKSLPWTKEGQENKQSPLNVEKRLACISRGSGGVTDSVSDTDSKRSTESTESKRSIRLIKPEVQSQISKRYSHCGPSSELQFDGEIPYVRSILNHMWDSFHTITVYCMGMLEPGDIIYYLRPFTVHHDRVSNSTVRSRSGSTALMQMKGRFGIVVSKFSEHIKVADATTFGHRGIEKAKSRAVFHEYVGLVEKDCYDNSQSLVHQPLEIESICHPFGSLTSVHLVTEKISISNQIMIAGHITSESLTRLWSLIREVEDSCIQ